MVNKMKYLGLVLLIALVSASPAMLGQQVGESCEKNPTFTVQYFDVTPWPIMGTQQYVVTMNGVFTSKEYVRQLYMGTKDGKGFWHYTYQTIDKEYLKGAVGNFTISLQGPSERGSYTDQFSLHRSDFSTLSCWQYTYDIK